MAHRIILALTLSLGLAAAARAQPCATMQYGWTYTFGGVEEEWGRAIGFGANGEIYLAGFFSDRVDFDPSPTKTDWHQSNGKTDSFYTFLNPDGSHRWTGTMGGMLWDSCLDLKVWGDRIYFGGIFRGPADLNPKRKEDIRIGDPDSGNAYLTLLGTDRKYQWTRTIDSQGSSLIKALTVDSGGNILSTGDWNERADFNPGKHKDVRTTNIYDDAFVWKLDPKGKYIWAHTFGGTNRDSGFRVAVDAQDNIFVAGVCTGDVDFDPRGKGDVHVGMGLWDAFLTSLSPEGKVRWSWTVGSATYDEAWGVGVGPDGRIYVTGYVSGTADFDAKGRGDVRELQGGADGFLSMFTPNGRYLETNILPGMNGNGQVVPRAMAIDAQRGVIAIGGYFSGTVDLDPGTGVDARTSNGSFDAFVVLLTLEGEHIESFTFGGDGQDAVFALGFDPGGNLLLTGPFYSQSVDFNTCGGGDIRQLAGLVDIYLTKYLCGGCK